MCSYSPSLGKKHRCTHLKWSHLAACLWYDLAWYLSVENLPESMLLFLFRTGNSNAYDHLLLFDILLVLYFLGLISSSGCASGIQQE